MLSSSIPCNALLAISGRDKNTSWLGSGSSVYQYRHGCHMGCNNNEEIIISKVVPGSMESYQILIRTSISSGTRTLLIPRAWTAPQVGAMVRAWLRPLGALGSLYCWMSGEPGGLAHPRSSSPFRGRVQTPGATFPMPSFLGKQQS